MRKTRNLKLNLLALEDRLTPAVTASLAAGNLTVTGDAVSRTILVSGTAGAYNVYAVAGDQYAVYQANPAAFLAATEIPLNQIGGTFGVTGFMNITTQNQDDTVIVTVDNGGSLPGNCSVTLNGGNDNVIVQSRDTKATAVGGISLKGGAGADNMFIFGLTVGGSISIDGGTSGFRGGVNSPLAPGDVFHISDSDTKAINVVNSIVGISDQFGPNTITGNLTVNNPTNFAQGGFIVNGVNYPAGFNTFGDPGYNGLLVINAGSVVNGSVTYIGAPDTDGTYIEGTVNGNVSLNGGTNTSLGNNDFVLSGSVTGFYTAAGTDGVDFGQMLDSANVGGPVQFNFREGDNTFDLDHTFKAASAVTVSAVGFTITALAGSDDVGRISGTIGKSGLATNQVYNLGAGDNSLIWNGTYVGLSTGRLDFTSLGGQDTLDVAGPNIFRLFANMGAGNDTVNVFINTSVSFSQLDGGLGIDTFNRNGNVFPVSYWGLTNFEFINP